MRGESTVMRSGGGETPGVPSLGGCLSPVLGLEGARRGAGEAEGSRRAGGREEIRVEPRPCFGFEMPKLLI